jgi:hypothetical protein
LLARGHVAPEELVFAGVIGFHFASMDQVRKQIENTLTAILENEEEATTT